MATKKKAAKKSAKKSGTGWGGAKRRQRKSQQRKDRSPVATRGSSMKVPLTTIYERLDFASDRLSTQIRTLTLGVLALVWLFLSGGKDAPALKLKAGNKQLLAIAGLCVLTFLIDAVQYWASTFRQNP